MEGSYYFQVKVSACICGHFRFIHINKIQDADKFSIVVKSSQLLLGFLKIIAQQPLF